jgi:hypothetical protein
MPALVTFQVVLTPRDILLHGCRAYPLGHLCVTVWLLLASGEPIDPAHGCEAAGQRLLGPPLP